MYICKGIYIQFLMTTESIITQLENNKANFSNLLENKSQEEYLWRSNPEKWCLLEIVCHLVDEEREDFRARVRHALEYSDRDLVPIDPVGWVVKRGYINQDYNGVLKSFLDERDMSIWWLKSLKDVNWNNEIVHAQLGPLSAKLFLTNWLAHDYLHIRQIIRYQYFYLEEKTGVDLNYAGKW